MLGGLCRPADRASGAGDPAADGQGRQLRAGACRRRLVQAAELDVAAVLAGRGAGPVDGAEQGRRTAGDHPGRGAARLASTISASIRDWSRTGSRRTCRCCWPSTSPRWGRAGRWSAGSSRRPIGPVDLMCRDGGRDRWRQRLDDGVGQRRERQRPCRPCRPCRPRSVHGRGTWRSRSNAGPHRRRRAAHPLSGLLNRDPLLAPVTGVFAAQQHHAPGPDAGDRPRNPLRRPGLRLSSRGIQVDGTLF